MAPPLPPAAGLDGPRRTTRASAPPPPVLHLPPHRPAELSRVPAAVERIVEVRRGDTLLSLLRRVGLAREDARAAVDALRPVFSPRELQSGQEMRLTFRPGPSGTLQLGAVRFDSGPDQEITLTRDEAGRFSAAAIDKRLTLSRARATGAIEANLFQAGMRSGVPFPVLRQLIQLFSYDVDLQRDLQPGNRFEVVYEQFEDEAGRPVKSGDVLFAALDLGDRSLAFYAFTTAEGQRDFYTRSGESIRKALLRTPIDGAEITSGFGMREHPILGFTRMHKGIDFGAPAGTPIYAAGDGTVVALGRRGGYGNYVRIRHNARYATAYAHASRFAKGLAVGSRVRQGQIVAYVGTTGRSTGPHLHYEVLVDGRQVDPQSVKLVGRRLQGPELKRFLAAVAEIDRLRAGPQDRVLVAERPAR
ncbi:MAG: M23 family metallopeptidase [Rhodospirillaceae bacterium]|nr:M23 family metallopeptidase [Rhodospirillaceae bacterium]